MRAFLINGSAPQSSVILAGVLHTFDGFGRERVDNIARVPDL